MFDRARTSKLFVACLGALLSCIAALAQFTYQDRILPVETRVADLLARMTPDEMFRPLFMVAGDLGTDIARFASGIFGFQLHTCSQVDAVQVSYDH